MKALRVRKTTKAKNKWRQQENGRDTFITFMLNARARSTFAQHSHLKDNDEERGTMARMKKK